MENTGNFWDAWSELSTVEGQSVYGKCGVLNKSGGCHTVYYPDNNPQPWEPDFPWDPPTSPHEPSPTDVIPWKPQYEDPNFQISIHERDGSSMKLPVWAIAGVIILLMVKK